MHELANCQRLSKVNYRMVGRVCIGVFAEVVARKTCRFGVAVALDHKRGWGCIAGSCSDAIRLFIGCLRSVAVEMRWDAPGCSVRCGRVDLRGLGWLRLWQGNVFLICR